MTEANIEINQVINLIKDHLIPYPKSADSLEWNERVGYLIEDIININKKLESE